MSARKLTLSELKKLVGQILKENALDDARNSLKSYVMDKIDFSGYSEYEGTPKSQNLQKAVEIFESEKGWDIKNIGLKRAFIDWLMGLPSILDIPYYYQDIRNLMYALGYDKAQDMDDRELSRLYYDELFSVFFGKNN